MSTVICPPSIGTERRSAALPACSASNLVRGSEDCNHSNSSPRAKMVNLIPQSDEDRIELGGFSAVDPTIHADRALSSTSHQGLCVPVTAFIKRVIARPSAIDASE